MAKQTIAVVLDEETVEGLRVLGEPAEVLARLADSAASGMRHPGRQKREQTDESLRLERRKSDAALAGERAAIDENADEVIRLARERADEVVQTALIDARSEPSPASKDIGASSIRARAMLENERFDADAVLEHERAEQRSDRADLLVLEREATDRDLVGERAHADRLIVDQQEANETMVGTTIRSDEAKDRAEESANELRSVAEFREMFIGILGHDLRNPLSSIVMSAALLLRRGRLDEHDAGTVARIIRSNQRMSRMITQILDLTRARLGGGLPIEPEPTDLREICQNVVEEFEATIHLEASGDLSGTWDKDRLAEVLSNLTGNAIEYAADGTDVVMKARSEGTEAVVEISNQGAPIPSELLPDIFEPFRRAKSTEKSATGNLGLGLYIAKQIVLSHGGTLDARSSDGTTTFVMRLPRTQAGTHG